VLLALAPAVASAQESPLSRGTRLIEAGQFDDALNVLLPAYANDPSAPLAHAAARAYDALRDDPLALRFYENALNLKPGLDPDARRRVQDRVRSIKDRLKNRPKKATLSIRTPVDGAAVLLNGEEVGRTPLSGVLVKPGSYRVRVQHDHFEPWEQSLTLAVYDVVTLDVQLTDRASDVLIHTEPAGASARVSSVNPAIPPQECLTPCLVPLRSGEYTVLLQRDGFPPANHRFVKLPGQVLEVRLNLNDLSPAAPLDPTKGRLVAGISHAGAQLIVDGVLVGTAPLTRPVPVAPGIHDIAVSLPGFKPWSARVQIMAGEQTTLSVQLEPLGGTALVPVTPPPRTPPPVTPPPVTPPPVFTPTPVTPPVYTPQPLYTPQPTVAPMVPAEPESMGGGSGDPVVGWSLTGTGIALVVGGTLAAVLPATLGGNKIKTATRFSIEQSATDDPALFPAEFPPGVYVSGMTRADAIEVEEDSKTWLIAGSVIAGVGVALIGTGIYFLVAGDGGDDLDVEIDGTGRRTFAPPTFHLSPWLSGDGYGGSAALTF
jgi:hypothetical protein